MACNGAKAPSSVQWVLQEAGSTETRNGIYHRLTFENPAGHRKSQCRVANMHESHSSPPRTDMRPRTAGEEPLTGTTLAVRHQWCNAPKVPSRSTEVIHGHQFGTVTPVLPPALKHLFPHAFGRCRPFQNMRLLPMEEQQVDQEHQNQNRPERADDGRPRRRVEAY